MEITGEMSSFFISDIILAYHALLPTNTDAICWRKPSNEHDPYAIAVLDNIGGGATGGLGCATHLCTAMCKDAITRT